MLKGYVLAFVISAQATNTPYFSRVFVIGFRAIKRS